MRPGARLPAGVSLRRALASPSLWAWLALASLPPDLLSKAFGLEMVDPAYLLITLLWWPLDTLGRLAALRILLEKAEPREAAWRRPQAALAAALAAEILLALRATVLGLLGLIPGLALFSLMSPERLQSLGGRLSLGGLCLLGLVPVALYCLRRMLSPLELLRSPMGAGEALDASEKRLRGRLVPFLKRALPWLALSLVLDGAGLLLPDWAASLLALPSLAASVVPIALAEDL